MGWSQRQTQEAIEAVMETGLFIPGPMPNSVTLDEEVLERLRERYRRILRKERMRMQAATKRPGRHHGPEVSILCLAMEIGLTQETAEQAAATLMEMGLVRKGSRPGTIHLNEEALG